MIQLYRIQLTSQTPFKCKILRAFVFLFIGNSIHSICIFFERRKCVCSVVIFNKGIEETFEVSCANFYDNCPRRAVIQGQLFGGQSCRGQLSSGAIVWGKLKIHSNLVVKNKVPPCSGSIALRHLKPIHKKGLQLIKLFF